LWRRRFTHFYKVPRTPGQHRRDQSRRAAPDRHLSRRADRKLVLVPETAADTAVAARLAQHGRRDGAFVQVHPGSRWMFKAWPAPRMSALVDHVASRGFGRRRPPARPTRGRRTLAAETIGGCTAATRARIVDLTGALTLSELAAVTARAPASSSGGRFGADAHRRRDGHAGARAVRAVERARVGAVAGPASHRRVRRASVPSVPPGRLRRRQGVPTASCDCRRRNAIDAFDALLRETESGAR
jgi:hypothetical protein